MIPGMGCHGSLAPAAPTRERDYDYGVDQAQQASKIDEESKWREEKQRAMYEQTMLSTWNTLCQAAKIRADHVLMGDLRRWLEKRRAEIDADIKRVDL